MADGRRQARLGWQIHESTARRLCQLAFLLLGALPVAVCLAWSGLGFLPAYQRSLAHRWERLLSDQLGVHVRVARYEAQAPERFRLHGIELRHPETGERIGGVQQVAATRAAGKWAIDFSQPELEQRELASAWKIVHDWFLCRPQRYLTSTELKIDELRILRGNAEQSLHDIKLEMTPKRDALRVGIGFRVVQPGASPANSTTRRDRDNAGVACALTIERYHNRNNLRTIISLKTGDGALPCSLVQGLVPQIQRLGNDAQFAGDLRLDQGGQDWWSLSLTKASFTGVDLGQLTAATEVPISGRGQIYFEKLDVGPQQIDIARGGLTIEAGQMPSRMLAAIAAHMDVSLRETNTVTHYGFDSLRVGFHVEPSQLRLVGGMTDRHGVLAARDESRWHQALPLQRVLDVLASCSGARTVDAVRAAGGLGKQALLWLPFDDQSAARVADARTELGSNPH